VDIDNDAMNIAYENAKNLGIEDKIQFILCDVNSIPSTFYKKFDIVLTNPPFGIRSKKEADVNFLKKALNVSFPLKEVSYREDLFST
jgi:predicted RNA methylase